MEVFLLDGVGYRVHVTKLTRKFAVLDSSHAGRTLDGRMYRDPIGTFYNYEMTLCPQNDDEMDRLWEALSQPVKSHLCTFPYNQHTLTQRMYVTAGAQDLQRITDRGNHWGEITVEFVAMEPKVTP